MENYGVHFHTYLFFKESARGCELTAHLPLPPFLQRPWKKHQIMKLISEINVTLFKGHFHNLPRLFPPSKHVCLKNNEKNGEISFTWLIRSSSARLRIRCVTNDKSKVELRASCRGIILENVLFLAIIYILSCPVSCRVLEYCCPVQDI